MNTLLPTSTAPNQAGISSFALKITAIVCMTLNHFCYIFYPYLPSETFCMLFGFGGLTFPIMAFLLVEGYSRTSNVKRYALRLFLFALISQVPYMLFLASNANVLFTLLIGLGALYAYDKVSSLLVKWGAIGVLCALSIFCDWGFLGVLMILMIHMGQDKLHRIIFPLLLPILGSGIPLLSVLLTEPSLDALAFALYPLAGCTATIPLLLSYNGSRGKPLKWFFYAYYPLHILALGLIKGLVFNDWTYGI